MHLEKSTNKEILKNKIKIKKMNEKQRIYLLVIDEVAFARFESLDLFVETFEKVFHLQQKNYLDCKENKCK
jgi:4-hydroxyphenylpyruvate dioxygenase-like putative hemolysin